MTETFQRKGKRYLLFTAFAITIILLFSTILVRTRSRLSTIMIKQNPKIMLGIMTDKSSEDRAILLDKFYKSHGMNNPRVIGPVYFFSDKLQKDLKKENFAIYEEMKTFPMVQLKIRPFIDDLLTKTIIMIDYFLNKTDADWLFRPTDDVFINDIDWPSNIFSVLEKYESPQTNPYIIGECRMDGEFPLVSGGSGQVISRKAAKMLYETRYELLRNRENRWEDWHIVQHAKKFGVNNNFMPFMMGHSFLREDYELMMNNEYDKIEKCSKRYKIEDDIGCVKGLQEFHKTIVMHQYWSRSESMIEQMRKIIKNAPPNIKWYHVANGTMVCAE